MLDRVLHKVILVVCVLLGHQSMLLITAWESQQQCAFTLQGHFIWAQCSAGRNVKVFGCKYGDDCECSHWWWCSRFHDCTGTAANLCRGQHSCGMFAHDGFGGGDPAPGRIKQLIVGYTCSDNAWSTENDTQVDQSSLLIVPAVPESPFVEQITSVNPTVAALSVALALVSVAALALLWHRRRKAAAAAGAGAKSVKSLTGIETAEMAPTSSGKTRAASSSNLTAKQAPPLCRTPSVTRQ